VRLEHLLSGLPRQVGDTENLNSKIRYQLQLFKHY
jgi:hypothetical protein